MRSAGDAPPAAPGDLFRKGGPDLKNEQSPLSDSEIVDLFWAREEAAIRETDAKYRRFLLSLARNILGDRDPQDSEECLDETYLAAWNTIPPQRPNSLAAYLGTIIRRKALDLFQRQNRTKKRIRSEMTVSLEEAEEMIGPSSVEEEERERELAAAISAFLRSRSREDRFLFVSRYYTADSIPDIAQMMQMSQRAVYKRLERIRKDLKEYLEKEGFTI